MKAEDNDRGINGNVTYSIETPNPTKAQAPFEILDPSSGVVVVKTQIDREDYPRNFIQVMLLKFNFFIVTLDYYFFQTFKGNS